jgi:hypothetical protein
MAKIERDLRIAFLGAEPNGSRISLVAEAVSVLQHLQAARDDPTLWLAHPNKPLRFRRPTPHTIDVLAWRDEDGWMAQRDHRSGMEEEVISLCSPTFYAPGPAMLDLGLKDLLPTKRLPVRLAVRRQPDRPSGQPLGIFHLHGHPALGWLASADGQDPSHGWLEAA